jgi:hypothetical protein
MVRFIFVVFKYTNNEDNTAIINNKKKMTQWFQFYTVSVLPQLFLETMKNVISFSMIYKMVKNIIQFLEPISEPNII